MALTLHEERISSGGMTLQTEEQSSASTHINTVTYSIVIVSYNSRSDLERCINSLQKSLGEAKSFDKANVARPGLLESYEIIVVDNASRDSSADYLRGLRNVRLIANSDNRGFSAACNQGAKIAGGEFLVFLNPDTIASAAFLQRMSKYFEDKRVGAVGPLSNYVAGLQKYELHSPERLSSLAANEIQNSINNLARSLSQSNNGIGLTSKLLIGFCLMVRRQLFEKLGAMDENLFLGNDDLDLSWRIRNAGYELVVASDAFVYHEGQKSFNTEPNPKVVKLVQESTDTLYLKLVKHYGEASKVPSSAEIWGIGWFDPSEEVKQKALQIKRSSPSKPSSDENWVKFCHVILIPSNCTNPIASLAVTLDSLPEDPSCEIIILNLSDTNNLSTRGREAARKLDFGSDYPLWQAVNAVFGILSRQQILFCQAGLRFSALFNHCAPKTLDFNVWQAAVLPLTQASQKSEGLAPAFVCGKGWLKDKLYRMLENPDGFLDGLASALASPRPAERLALPVDLPSCEWRQTVNQVSQTEQKLPEPILRDKAINPVKEKTETSLPTSSRSLKAIPDYSAFPECIRSSMVQAQNILFVGDTVRAIPAEGTIEGFDPQGKVQNVSQQDLIILRLTGKFADHQGDGLKNLHRQASKLSGLLVIAKASEQEQGKLEVDSVRQDLWESGFSIDSEASYQIEPSTQELQSQGSGSEVKARSNEGILFTCHPRTADEYLSKKVSIIILGFNQLEYTRKCIESIVKHTRQSYELILVDNGSQDDTHAFFSSLSDSKSKSNANANANGKVKVIRNAENLGVSRGWNQAMRLAEGDYLLIFNNDTLVGPGCLENMVRLAEQSKDVGIVGPRSNNISGPQLIPNIAYKTEQEMFGFAAEWQTKHALSSTPFERITGFCMLIPKIAFEKIGYFDERFGKGNFEDDDYCLRARYHDLKLLIANDSFVHHYGSVSFKQANVDWHALMKENQIKFQNKWAQGRTALNDTYVFQETAKSVAEKNLLLEAQKAYLAENIPEARRLYLDAQLKNPLDPEPYNGLGIIQFHEGQISEAVVFFKKCMDLDPRHKDAALNLMDALRSHCGGEDTARPAFQMLAQRYPCNTLFQSAVLPPSRFHPSPEDKQWIQDMEKVIAAGHLEEAEKQLQAKQSKGLLLDACYNMQGILCAQRSDWEASRQFFLQAHDLNPSDHDILMNLVEALERTGKEAELEKVYRKSLIEGHCPISDDLEQLYLQWLHRVDPSTEAENPDSIAHAGENLLREGLLEKAQQTFAEALRVSPRHAAAMNGMALVHWYRDEGEAAWERFSLALQWDVNNVDILINTFDAALATGRLPLFIQLLQSSRKESIQSNERVTLERAMAFDQASIYMAGSYESVEKLDTLLSSAESKQIKNDFGGATLDYLAALEAFPTHARALMGLGQVALQWNKAEEAYAFFVQAARSCPVKREILELLWKAAGQAGKLEAAKLIFDHAIACEPALKSLLSAQQDWSSVK